MPTYMGRFINEKLAAAALIFLLNSSVCQAEVVLDKLNACKAISEMFESMEGEGQFANCRSPRGPLERKIQSYLLNPSDICFRPAVSDGILAGFSCEASRNEKGKEITCFRDYPANDIHDFKVNFEDEFRTAQSVYLKAAANCTSPPSDASSAQDTLFPPAMQTIAVPEFGFIISLPPDSNGKRTVVHGFAMVDPQLAEDESRGLEYISAWTSASDILPTEVGDPVGDWFVKNEDMAEFNKNVDQQFKKAIASVPGARSAGVKVKMEAGSQSFRRKLGAHASQGDKRQFLRSLASALGSDIEGEGFSAVDEDEMTDANGNSFEDMIDKAFSTLPAGARAISQLRILKPVDVYLKISPVSCSHHTEGAMFVMVMEMEPESGVESDIGSVTEFVVRLGSCASGQAPADFSSSLLEQLSGAISDFVRSQK